MIYESYLEPARGLGCSGTLGRLMLTRMTTIVYSIQLTLQFDYAFDGGFLCRPMMGHGSQIDHLGRRSSRELAAMLTRKGYWSVNKLSRLRKCYLKLLLVRVLSRVPRRSLLCVLRSLQCLCIR